MSDADGNDRATDLNAYEKQIKDWFAASDAKVRSCVMGEPSAPCPTLSSIFST